MEKNLQQAALIIGALGLLLGLSLGQNYRQHQEIQYLKRCVKHPPTNSFFKIYSSDCEHLRSKRNHLKQEIRHLSIQTERLNPELQDLKMEIDFLKEEKAELLFEISDLKMEY